MAQGFRLLVSPCARVLETLHPKVLESLSVMPSSIVGVVYCAVKSPNGFSVCAPQVVSNLNYASENTILFQVGGNSALCEPAIPECAGCCLVGV